MKRRITNLQQLVGGKNEKLCEVKIFISKVFYRCGCLMESLENFEKAGDWQMTFALSDQLGHDRGQRSKLARKMAGE